MVMYFFCRVLSRYTTEWNGMLVKCTPITGEVAKKVAGFWLQTIKQVQKMVSCEGIGREAFYHGGDVKVYGLPSASCMMKIKLCCHQISILSSSAL